jgi:hypothetical protein
MHDRAMDPIGAPTSATATATEIMILLSIESAYTTDALARRQPPSFFVLTGWSSNSAVPNGRLQCSFDDRLRRDQFVIFS